MLNTWILDGCVETLVDSVGQQGAAETYFHHMMCRCHNLWVPLCFLFVVSFNLGCFMLSTTC